MGARSTAKRVLVVRLVLGLAVVFTTWVDGNIAAAQMPEEPTSYELEFSEVEELPPGRYAFVEGKATPDGDHFYVENLEILQPVTVTLVAKNSGDKIDLKLSKYRYEDFDREGATDSNGGVSFKIRTQGELKILVSADGEPKPYILSVWIGEFMKSEMQPVLVSAEEYGESAGSGFSLGGSMVLWVIVLLLVVIAAFLGVIALRKGGSA